jgi:hypothetical protein
MSFKSGWIFFVAETLVLALCAFPEYYKELAFALFCISLLRLLHKIGNGSFFLELILVYSAFTCLLMPLIGYVFFPRSNFLSLTWVRYMPIPEQQYYSFNLPAVIFLGWGFFLFRSNSPDDASVINPIVKQIRRDIVKIHPSLIYGLVLISLFAYSISAYLPASLQQVNTFLYYSLFAGFFYVIFYKDFPGRLFMIAGIILFLLYDSVQSGMFTIIAYMGGLFTILLLAGRKIMVGQKVLFVVLGVFFIVFLQLFKLDLRQSRKRGNETDVVQVATRVVNNAQNSSFQQILFPLYYRMNQGHNIAMVQQRIPARVEHIGGNYLFLSFLSAFVPRLFWPDKPEAGGKANMKLYVGVEIRSWSTNVGPLGEAYGSFGYLGGWIYLLIFGMFIQRAYTYFISMCKRRPVLFLWMPPLFFQTVYVTETDSLQAFNSLIKGAIFMFILFKVVPGLFPERSEVSK